MAPVTARGVDLRTIAEIRLACETDLRGYTNTQRRGAYLTGVLDALHGLALSPYGAGAKAETVAAWSNGWLRGAEFRRRGMRLACCKCRQEAPMDEARMRRWRWSRGLGGTQDGREVTT